MKNITIIILFLLSLSSCSYDYEMPNYSNATPLYSIKELPAGIQKEWRRIAISHGLDLNISQEKWETVVTEKNAKGDILYKGSPRIQADNTACSLEVAFRCLGRFKKTDWEYYEICTFKLSTAYDLAISPISCIVEISKDNTYTVEPPPASEQVYRYNITYGSDVTMLIINTTESLGYDVSGAEMIITEKNKDGRVLFRGYRQNVNEMSVSKKGAQTVEVAIESYGWPKGNHNQRVKVGTLQFDEPIELKTISNKTMKLTTNMPSTFVR